MSRTYQNPPLVEIIAELRWGPSQIQLPNLQIRNVDTHLNAPNANSDEEVYMRFGALSAVKGYSNFERLVPPGFPVGPHQVVYRYRHSNPVEETSLYQLGNGVFTVNATPPYKSWSAFGPIAEQGLEMLQNAFRSGGASAPVFNTLLVRYIDAFREEMTEGASTLEFLAESLGVRLDLPAAILDQCVNKDEIVATIQLQMPVGPGTLQLQFGHGQVGNETAIIMDTTVAIAGEMPCDAKEVLMSLTKAHDVIHNLFIKLTSKLDPIMRPSEE